MQCQLQRNGIQWIHAWMDLPSKGVPEASDSCDKQDNQNFRYRVLPNDRVFTQVLILDIVVGRYSTEKSLSTCLSIPFHACLKMIVLQQKLQWWGKGQAQTRDTPYHSVLGKGQSCRYRMDPWAVHVMDQYAAKCSKRTMLVVTLRTMAATMAAQ